MDWSSFLAVEFWALVTMTTILASAFATLVGYVQRRRSRPEADWAVRPVRIHRPREAGAPYILQAIITNVGDGYAFRVRATGHHCSATMKGEAHRTSWGMWRPTLPFAPLVEPGQEEDLDVSCQLADWDRAEIEIEWTPPPTRLRKRIATRIPLREVRPAPEPEPDDRKAASVG